MRMLKIATEDRLHNAESAAELLGVRPSTIRWWWTTGKLQRVKIGRLTRVRESQLLELIKPEQATSQMKAERDKFMREGSKTHD